MLRGRYRRPGLKMPCGSNARLQPLVDARTTAAPAAGTRRPTCRRRETASRGRRAAAAVRGSPRRRQRRRAQPALRPAPLDQLRRRRARAAARSAAPTGATGRVRCSIASRREKNAWRWSRRPCQNGAAALGDRLAAELARRRLDRGRGAGQAQRQRRRSCQALARAAAAGRPSAFERRSASASRMSKRSVASATGRGSTLSDTSAITPERAERAGQQARDVVAGDVLHHLAAEVQHLAAARRSACAPSTKSRTAPAAARGAGRTGRPRPCRRGSRPAPKCGGSNASIWPCSASAASISASGVPRAR